MYLAGGTAAGLVGMVMDTWIPRRAKWIPRRAKTGNNAPMADGGVVAYSRLSPGSITSSKSHPPRRSLIKLADKQHRGATAPMWLIGSSGGCAMHEDGQDGLSHREDGARSASAHRGARCGPFGRRAAQASLHEWDEILRRRGKPKSTGGHHRRGAKPRRGAHCAPPGERCNVFARQGERAMRRGRAAASTSIDDLPDELLVHVFSQLAREENVPGGLEHGEPVLRDGHDAVVLGRREEGGRQ